METICSVFTTYLCPWNDELIQTHRCSMNEPKSTMVDVHFGPKTFVILTVWGKSTICVMFSHVHWAFSKSWIWSIECQKIVTNIQCVSRLVAAVWHSHFYWKCFTIWSPGPNSVDVILTDSEFTCIIIRARCESVYLHKPSWTVCAQHNSSYVDCTCCLVNENVSRSRTSVKD